MKKKSKKIAISLIALIFLLALFVAAWVFLVFPNLAASKVETDEADPGPVQIAEYSGKIAYNEENGALYTNNEIIVFVTASASEDKVSALFEQLEANVDEAMADIGVYRLTLKNAMTYDELETLIEKIKSDPIVETAYLNTVVELEPDTDT